jgi:hypothetical protein
MARLRSLDSNTLFSCESPSGDVIGDLFEQSLAHARIVSLADKRMDMLAFQLERVSSQAA